MILRAALGFALVAGFLPGRVGAGEYRVHGAVLGDYVREIGPSLAQSRGLMPEIAAAAFEAAGLTVATTPAVPWARAESEAAEDPGGLLLLLARTPLREPLWHWLTPIYVDSILAFTLPGHPVFTSLAELKQRHPAIGVRLASASESFLTGLEVPVAARVETAVSLKMMMQGRLDVVLTQGMLAVEPMRQIAQGPDGAAYQPLLSHLVRTPIQSLPLWLVASPTMPADDSAALQSAIDRFKQTPTYQAICARYETAAAVTPVN